MRRKMEGFICPETGEQWERCRIWLFGIRQIGLP